MQFMISFLLLAMLSGCDRPFTRQMGWKPEDFFTNPQTIALVIAIEKNDLNEMKRLMAAGADANAKGKDNNTPLLWAFFDNKPERFKLLLEHGADPNVIFESDFGSGGGIKKGSSVVHMAAKSAFPEHFELVMKHGADPNLKDGSDESPVSSVIGGTSPEKKKRLQMLIDAKADLDHISSQTWQNPLRYAVSFFGQFDLALMLLKAGADPDLSFPKSRKKIVHEVLYRRERVKDPGTLRQADEVLEWLNNHGQDVEQAKADIRRWSEEGNN
jgi:ankyrin repeat protein